MVSWVDHRVEAVTNNRTRASGLALRILSGHLYFISEYLFLFIYRSHSLLLKKGPVHTLRNMAPGSPR